MPLARKGDYMSDEEKRLEEDTEGHGPRRETEDDTEGHGPRRESEDDTEGHMHRR